ncbi:MAG: hypothetical protein CSA04_02360, partial [Bacteroidetes bacterium]
MGVFSCEDISEYYAINNQKRIKAMNVKKNGFLLLLLVGVMSFLFVACEEEKPVDPPKPPPTPPAVEFLGVESPFLICAGRNPGGVGFDFLYKDQKGGANNMDSLHMDDFAYDLKIRTIKGEKPNGQMGGAPFIRLHDDVQAVNYSQVDTTCKGRDAFEALTAENIQEYLLASDAADFDLSSLPTGTTGAPLMSALKEEYAK